MADKCYIVVAENFASVLTVFRISMDSRLERPSAKKVLSIAVPGIAACAVALIDGHHYLIGASYHDNGWKTQSKVFLFDPIMESLSEVQAITTFGAHDAEIGACVCACIRTSFKRLMLICGGNWFAKGHLAMRHTSSSPKTEMLQPP